MFSSLPLTLPLIGNTTCRYELWWCADRGSLAPQPWLLAIGSKECHYAWQVPQCQAMWNQTGNAGEASSPLWWRFLLNCQWGSTFSPILQLCYNGPITCVCATKIVICHVVNFHQFPVKRSLCAGWWERLFYPHVYLLAPVKLFVGVKQTEYIIGISTQN